MGQPRERSAGEPPAGARAPPSPDEVRAQLARILGSPEFAVPQRGRDFLRHVVEETLAGHADRLKGYTIATSVFERDASFDAQADPVVRIEAGRLRRALERYYLVAGQADPVLIEVPKGGYVPTFARRTLAAPGSPAVEEQPPAAAAPPRTGTAAPTGWRALAAVAAGMAAVALVLGTLNLRSARQPAVMADATALPEVSTLLVMPFASLGGGDEARLYAAGITEDILTQLSRFKELAVLGRETTRSIPADADAESIAATS